MKLQFFLNPVMAGFPSPASDYVDKSIDLNEILIKNIQIIFLYFAFKIFKLYNQNKN